MRKLVPMTLLSLFLGISLSACGQVGPLTLPKEQSPNTSTSA